MADENRATETDDLLDRVDAAVEASDRAALDAALEPMHPADIADLIERLTPGDRRAFLAWERLILPNGKSLLLSQAPGVDAQGAVGVGGRVNRRLGALAVATLFAGAITTLGQVARDDRDGGGLWGDVGDAAAIEAAAVGSGLIERELEVRPSIRLRAGAPVRVMITRDLILEPYRP